MTIAAILAKKGGRVVSVDAALRVRDAAALLAENRFGSLPVLDGQAVAGILSERDIVYCLAGNGAAVLDWPVSRLMTTPAVTVTPDVSVLAALPMMRTRPIRHLPVGEDGNLSGILSTGGLLP